MTNRRAAAPSLLCGAALSAAVIAGAPAAAQIAPDPSDWAAVLQAAEGQTVYFNHWGGEPRINAYVAWVGERTEELYGVSVVSVRLTDTAEAVGRVLAERAAGTLEGGAVDLIWINGENFASMLENGLLFGPWADQLPNFRLTAPDDNPFLLFDFTVPTGGFEAPWSAAQFVFFADSEFVTDPPSSAAALLEWAERNPGRFTYPAPPDFLGSTFLKQALLELAPDADALTRPVEEADFDAATAPLWAFLDALHPHLWRSARAFPQNGAELRRLVGDGELEIGFAFGAGEPAAAVATGELPESTITFMFDDGMIGDVNFVAIPFNASSAAGAMVVADFMMSPEAQARKLDPEYWGADTVLDFGMLSPEERGLFEALDLGAATIPHDERAPTLPQPHPSWMVRIEQEWARRYGAG